MKLRDEYQTPLDNRIVESWAAGNRNVLAVLPTGGGKTVNVGHRIKQHVGASCVVAHRAELVAQVAMSLARFGVQHRIIGNRQITRRIDREQRAELGVSFVNANAQCAVASVDTLVRKTVELRDWMQQVTLWVIDEAHHCLRGNKWGKVAEIFPNAKGLGVTATPIRADGQGLGSHADGIFDDMVVGVGMRWLIDRGFLTEYRIFCPLSDMDVSQVKIGKNGDYNRDGLKKASRGSHIVGDVVEQYLKFAKGLRGVTFATDVETATEISAKFNASGIPAEVVSAKTKIEIRGEILARFGRGEILQLVNVDLFGEGFDLPAISVVSFARPTQSYSLYAQQFGRALRILEGKSVALIIDHVGNVIRHRAPDAEREWSLDKRDSRGANSKAKDEIPITACPECTQPYERVNTSCPWCGHKPAPAQRSSPEFVDGDLAEMSKEALDELRKRVEDDQEKPEAVMSRMKYAGAPQVAVMSAGKNIRRKLDSREVMKSTMAEWIKSIGEKDQSVVMKRFWFRFGTDILTAQMLTGRESLEMAEKMNIDIIGNSR